MYRNVVFLKIHMQITPHATFMENVQNFNNLFKRIRLLLTVVIL